jgi:hypothetical protein
MYLWIDHFDIDGDIALYALSTIAGGGKSLVPCQRGSAGGYGRDGIRRGQVAACHCASNNGRRSFGAAFEN